MRKRIPKNSRLLASIRRVLQDDPRLFAGARDKGFRTEGYYSDDDAYRGLFVVRQWRGGQSHDYVIRDVGMMNGPDEMGPKNTVQWSGLVEWVDEGGVRARWPEKDTRRKSGVEIAEVDFVRWPPAFSARSKLAPKSVLDESKAIKDLRARIHSGIAESGLPFGELPDKPLVEFKLDPHTKYMPMFIIQVRIAAGSWFGSDVEDTRRREEEHKRIYSKMIGRFSRDMERRLGVKLGKTEIGATVILLAKRRVSVGKLKSETNGIVGACRALSSALHASFNEIVLGMKPQTDW